MSYYVQTRWGDSEDNPSEQRMRELLAELDITDPEHPDTWLSHENGWTISVFESGLVIWENVEEEVEPRHQLNVPRERALALWAQLSKGDIAAIQEEPWQPGQSPPRSEEEQAAIQKAAEDSIRESDREFYDSLGEERRAVPCQNGGCTRGAVEYSVLCRVHHFESVRRKPCPFSH